MLSLRWQKCISNQILDGFAEFVVVESLLILTDAMFLPLLKDHQSGRFAEQGGDAFPTRRVLSCKLVPMAT